MGVLNITPDSFSDGGRHFEADRAVEHALLMDRDGADIIDIGGESTRPYSKKNLYCRRDRPCDSGHRGAPMVKSSPPSA